MIKPGEVAIAAKKVEKKNLKFRTFLKNRAESSLLDRQFAKLNQELFANYDCSRCRNCCRNYTIILKKRSYQGLQTI